LSGEQIAVDSDQEGHVEDGAIALTSRHDGTADIRQAIAGCEPRASAWT